MASGMTPEQVFSAVQQLVESGYSELPNYRYQMRDLMLVGISAFTEDIRTVRGWAERVLKMVQEVRQLKGVVSGQTRGFKRLYEIALVQRISEARRTDSLPPGMGEKERMAWAAQQSTAEWVEYERWHVLEDELRAYMETLQEAHNELVVARSDIKSQLWAVRLHGILGELGTEARADEQMPWNRAAKSGMAMPPAPVEGANVDVDNLLGGNGKID